MAVAEGKQVMAAMKEQFGTDEGPTAVMVLASELTQVRAGAGHSHTAVPCRTRVAASPVSFTNHVSVRNQCRTLS